MLPDLPKKYKRKEADITPLVLKWFATHYPKSCAIEVKIVGGKLKDHQEIALKQVASGTFTYKIPDMGRILPFDGFLLKDADAFVVVCDGHQCKADSITGDKSFMLSV